MLQAELQLIGLSTSIRGTAVVPAPVLMTVIPQSAVQRCELVIINTTRYVFMKTASLQCAQI